MENEYWAGLVLMVVSAFVCLVTHAVKKAKKKIEASEAKKELIKNKVSVIKQRWIGKQ